MGCPDAGRFDLISYDVPARRNATYLDVERWEWRERDARCFSCPSNREIWGRVDCEKMRESARANLRESVKFRRLKTAQAYGIRAKRKRGYLYLSLSLSLSLCALWRTTRHLHLWTWLRIRMNIRFFKIDGVCVVNKGSFLMLKPVLNLLNFFLKLYYIISLHWKEVRKMPGRIAIPVRSNCQFK